MYIFILSFVLLSSFFPRLTSSVADWMSTIIPHKKNRHLGTIAQICRAISSQLRHVSTIGKNLLNSNTSSICPDNMVNFSPLAAEICLPVWGTPAKFNGFRILAALLHGTLVVRISQTLWHRTDRGRHLYSAGWPSRWALARISSY